MQFAPRLAAFCVSLLAIPLLAPTPAAGAAEACATPGVWIEPGSGAQRDSAELLSSLAAPGIVLLGETHTSAANHRWQLHTLAGLQAHHPEVVVGFEMFPRRIQPALDGWSRGDYEEAAFLEAADWQNVWGYGADLYLPLPHFARHNRLPTVALNVERSLVSRVGQEGWAAVPEEQREGVTDPAPASEAYRHSLARVYQGKQRHGATKAEGEAETTIDEILELEGFGHFVEAQLTWDRAMAEALLAARRAHPEAMVVGIIGRGHMEYGYGISHQLAALGEERVTVLLPEQAGESCERLEAEVADAVFLLDSEPPPAAPPPRPRLGVYIETAEEGVRVMSVVDDSVAAATGLEDGDLITAAAGFPTATSDELIAVIQRQAPGTWLPLQVRRGDEALSLVAEFPTVFE